MTTSKHIAFIMDGNGRWAQAQGLPRLAGHKKGVETVRRMLEAAGELNISHMTFYAFSSENWSRSEEEVGGLMALAREYFKKELNNLIKNGVKLRFIGDRSPEGKLPADILEIIRNAEEKTAHNDGVVCTFALNYGGRDEIVRAVRRAAESLENLSEEAFEHCLDTRDLPPIDLMIRTGGEKRISNFLLWQLAYAELSFAQTMWPDFQKEELAEILTDFESRNRRFGGITDQAS